METSFRRLWEKGDEASWVVMLEVDSVVEVEEEREADRVGDGGFEFVVGVIEGEEGGPWKSLRMSALVGVGAGADGGAGASGFVVDDFNLDKEWTTGFVVVREIIVAGAGFWKSLRILTLTGFGTGVGEGAGVSGFVAVEEMIAGGEGFVVGLNCFTNDRPAC